MVSICVSLWGRSGFQKAYSVICPTINILAAIGPSVIAYIAKGTGSYTISYLVMLILAVIAAICNLLIKKDNVIKKEKEFCIQDGVEFARE